MRDVSTWLDLLGVSALSVFAYFIWPPAPLLVVGVAALVAGYASAAGGDDS